MFLSLMADVVTEETTDLVQLISIIAVAAVLIVLAVLCIANRGRSRMNTKAIVYAAVCIAASFVLSFIKISPVQYGGSITLASFVPILIYAYAFGPVRGLLVGIVYGVLQFIQDPFILTPLTFILDFLLAFSSIALMGFASKFTKSTMKNVVIGAVAVYLARFVFHLISGVVYFNMDQVWADLPTPNAFVYSLIYQCVYLPADAVITVAVLCLLVQQKAFGRLVGMMKLTQDRAPVSVTVSQDTEILPEDQKK